MPEPKYIILRRLYVKDGEELGPVQAIAKDGANNIFVLTTILKNNKTQLLLSKLVLQLKNAETPYRKVGEWDVPPAEGQKLDDLGMIVLDRDVIIGGNAHSAIPLNVDPFRNDTHQLIIFEGLGDVAPAASGYIPGPEPCVLPEKLNYFRPGAPVRRDQLLLMFFRFAKWIIALLTSGKTPALVIPTKQAFQDVAPPAEGKAPSELYQAAGWGKEINLTGGYPCQE